MRRVLIISGAVLVILGAVWMLQGLNVLPGSFMTGRPEWAVYGATAICLGAALFLFAGRFRRR